MFKDPSKEKTVPLNKDNSVKKEGDNKPSDDNPMVNEKVSSKDTKSPREKNLEGYAHAEVKDTSVLTKKDSDKVKPVWDEDNKNSVVAKSPQEGGFWSNIWGSKQPTHDEVPDTPTQQNYQRVFDKASTANGNPMVYEKRSQDPTKPNWERKMESHAEQNIRDTSSLVGKDTEKVRGVWEDKAVRDQGRVPPAENEKSSSFWSHLFGKENVEQAEKTVEKTEETISDKAHKLYNNAAGAVENASDKLKHETDQAAVGLQQAQRNAYDKGAELKREASERFSGKQDHISGNTETWKNNNDQKSWYDKGAEQVKSSFNNIKTEADKDIEWAGQKIQNGVSNAKDEVHRVFNQQEPNKKGISGHVLRGEKFAEEEFGQLRHTRDNTKLKPAEVIVRNAHGKEM